MGRPRSPEQVSSKETKEVLQGAMILAYMHEDDPLQETQEGSSSREAEQVKEMEEAATILCSMKHAQLTEKAAVSLREMIAENREGRRRGRPVQEPTRSQQGHVMMMMGLVPWRAPPLPPIPSIVPMMGQCSLPFWKQLNASDTGRQCRLVIRSTDLVDHIQPLLTEQELETLKPKNNNNNGKQKKKKGEDMDVEVFDWLGVRWNMKLAVRNSLNPVVKRGWVSFVRDHCLRAYEDLVCIWAFRNQGTGALSLAIISVPAHSQGL